VGIPSGYTSAQVVQAVPTGINSALVYITGATFSAVTSFSLPTNTFTSTYRNYKIIVKVTDTVSAANITMRARIAGADRTTRYYQMSPAAQSNSGTASNVGEGNASSLQMGNTHAATAAVWSCELTAFDPQVSGTYKGFAGFLISGDGTYYYGRAFVGSTDSGGGAALQVDSLSFISSVANCITGYYRVYGLVDS